MKILITGSNGFIGSNIAKALAEKHQIIGVGRSEHSIVNDIEYFRFDISDSGFPDSIQSYLGYCDVIVHLAANLDKSDLNLDIIKTNAIGTLNILNAALKLKAKKIVHASSIPLIGKPYNIPITEEHSTFPESLYHGSKLFSENILDLGKKSGLFVTHLRISAPVGIGMNEDTFIPIVIRNLINSKPIELFGNGSRIQNYIHISDICLFIDRAVDIDSSGIFNLASHQSISNLDLVNLAKNLLKSSSEIMLNIQEDIYEDYIWEISMMKTIKTFDISPKISLEYLLKELAEYYISQEK